MIVVGSLVSLVVWLSLAVTAGLMADERGQPPALWFVLGLFFPVLALIALVILFQRDGEPEMPELTLADAAQRNPVSRALGSHPQSSVDQLAQLVAQSPKAVAGDLRELRRLGLAERDESGRWSLTGDGAEALHGNTPADSAGP